MACNARGLAARNAGPCAAAALARSRETHLQAAGSRLAGGGRDVAAAAHLTERELEIKLSIAQSTDRLDLSNCELRELPPALFGLTGLVELSLAGNQLPALPADVGALSSLQRLVLAGNWLEHLPQELWDLGQLEGLWVHGNLLQDLPPELGHLSRLRMLSLAGNRLARVPDTLTQLVHLQDLNLSGNQLQELPEGLCNLTALTMLSLHGNRLRALPERGWEALGQLREATLQGNELSRLPDSLAQLTALTELSIADNCLESLPAQLSGLASLKKFHAYGNRIAELPLGPGGLPALLPTPRSSSSSGGGGGGGSGSGGGGGSAAWSSGSNDGDDAAGRRVLRSVDAAEEGGAAAGGGGGRLVSLWLEGNPLSEACCARLVEAMGPVGTTRVGLDAAQLRGEAGVAYQRLRAAGNTSVRRGVIEGEGPGYFKLQLGPGAPEGSGGGGGGRVLVVAFGSAPGLPNWGGVMRQVAAAAEEPAHNCFDVLYVVDPHRSWYCGGDEALMRERYGRRLERYTSRYSHVVMVGDSMGATGALLFSPLATSVLAFCPQVDLATSSIRPGEPPAWQAALQGALQGAVGRSAARVRVFTGTWQHDIDQANLLAHHPHVHVKAFSVESHRLALALQRQRKLAPLIREAVLGEVGIASGNVRLVNLL